MVILVLMYCTQIVFSTLSIALKIVLAIVIILKFGSLFIASSSETQLTNRLNKIAKEKQLTAEDLRRDYGFTKYEVSNDDKGEISFFLNTKQKKKLISQLNKL